MDVFGIGASLSPTDRGLLVLTLIIVGTLIIAVLFSAYAVLLRIRHRRREELRTRLKALWEGPVLGAIADSGRVADVHRLVPRKYRLHFVQFVLEYARRVRGQERETLRRLVDPYLDEIARRVDHRRAEVRTRAVQTLGTLGLPKYSDEVLQGLEDPSPMVSMVAARYLARPEYPQYGPALMRHLEQFEGWDRYFLASMLAVMGAEVSPRLRVGIRDESQPSWLRAVYAEALRMQVDARAADDAVEALRGTRDRDLSASLLRLVAAVGRPEHLPLIRILCSDEDEVIRAQALHALGVLGDAEELPILLEGLNDTSPWAALHAARGVRDAGGAGILEDLAESDGELERLVGQVLVEEAER